MANDTDAYLNSNVSTGAKIRKDGSLKCKCGSTSNKATLICGKDKTSEGYGNWIVVSCRKCSSTLYYNGA